MHNSSLQDLCELGSQQLFETHYLEAEATLALAEEQAWAARDWDTLARLYMPLQEVRRQRRQQCGEGVVALDLIAEGPDVDLDGQHIVENFPHGQLLVAGWKSVKPAMSVRKQAAAHRLYVETFLGAVYPVAGIRVIVIAPLDVDLPQSDFSSMEALKSALPPHSVLLDETRIIRGRRRGTPATFGEVMAMWERLHTSFLGQADAEHVLIRKVEGYRRTTHVDYACELAHQRLSGVAHELARQTRQRRRT